MKRHNQTRTTSPTTSNFPKRKIYPSNVHVFKSLPGLGRSDRASSLEKISEMLSMELNLSVNRGSRQVSVCVRPTLQGTNLMSYDDASRRACDFLNHIIAM